MKERITPKDDIEIYNAVTNENTDKTQVLKWALCGKDYEDLEEQGLIVRLKGGLDNDVWLVNKEKLIIDFAEISEVEIDRYGNQVYTLFVGKKLKTEYYTQCAFNDIIFNTRPEAEKKLKELKGEE